jgi:hypothetical protein
LVVRRIFKWNTFYGCRRRPYPYGCVNSFAQFWFYPHAPPPPSCWLGWILAPGCAEEFTHVAKVLAPLALVLTSLKMIIALLALHPLDTYSPCLDSLLDF